MAQLFRQDIQDALPTTVRTRPVDRGRLGVYAAIGATVGAVPIPWVPDALARRVRGALVHDIAARHGLSLTQEARDVLAEPAGPDGPRSVLAQAVRFVGARVALRALTSSAPRGRLAAPQRARTYVLGHLFDRYLELARTERAVRIDVEEARRVRLAIDGAFVRALTVDPPRVAEPTASTTSATRRRCSSTACSGAAGCLRGSCPARGGVRRAARAR